MTNICVVAGARPNFMKVAPLIKELHRRPEAGTLIVHTGQHYDKDMSGRFFEELEIPEPDVSLGVGSGSHAEQTARVMVAFEKVVLRERPEVVIVVGDVNSTLACALTAVKLGVRVAHVEAGLRSFDRAMPEEINRIATDSISDYLFITEESARQNLILEGHPEEKIFFAGNVMIDTLLMYKEKAAKTAVLSALGLEEASGAVMDYAVLTLHRPSNVDDREAFRGIIEAVHEISKEMPVIFPAHPRTADRIKQFGFGGYFGGNGAGPPVGVNLTGPLGYLDFLHLISRARLVLTDSGGIQEETTIMGVPCVTLRDNTERPVTVTHGTNRLAGTEKASIIRTCREALNGRSGRSGKNNFSAPPLWDGRAAERIIDILFDKLRQEGRLSRESAK